MSAPLLRMVGLPEADRPTTAHLLGVYLFDDVRGRIEAAPPEFQKGLVATLADRLEEYQVARFGDPLAELAAGN